MRVNIIMACNECKQRNYTSDKNKKTNPDRLELKKYCKFCRTKTVHRETR
ncbi:MAG: 50S ribosomal protein L33 [Clostridiales bacterium]|nr:50S ribosomal protein L33 [Clostridiales bacterium]